MRKFLQSLFASLADNGPEILAALQGAADALDARRRAREVPAADDERAAALATLKDARIMVLGCWERVQAFGPADAALERAYLAITNAESQLTTHE